MALENFTTYTEIDVPGRLSETAPRVTWTNISQNEECILYKDFGAGYFAGNFKIEFTLAYTNSNGFLEYIAVLTNAADSYQDIKAANGSVLSARIENAGGTNVVVIAIQEEDSGTQYTASAITNGAINTDYYCTLERDEATGTYGTLTLKVYSDVGRITQVGSTASITLHSSKKDFQYLSAVNGKNGNEQYAYGYLEALEIVSNISTPTVSTQPATAISGTTATGNGTISDLGSSSVTEHGHCWATTINPTTADSKTTNGAGALGAFTSSITDLTAGVPYFFRAYATNTAGTSYGDNVYFRAGLPQTQRTKAGLTIKGTTIRYVGFDGAEYYVQGIAV